MVGEQQPGPEELTTEQAAALLGVTPLQLIELVEAEAIPSFWTSSGYRFAPDDVTAYKQRGVGGTGQRTGEWPGRRHDALRAR